MAFKTFIFQLNAVEQMTWAGLMSKIKCNLLTPLGAQSTYRTNTFYPLIIIRITMALCRPLKWVNRPRLLLARPQPKSCKIRKWLNPHTENAVGKVVLFVGISQWHICHYMVIIWHFPVLLTLVNWCQLSNSADQLSCNSHSEMASFYQYYFLCISFTFICKMSQFFLSFTQFW